MAKIRSRGLWGVVLSILLLLPAGYLSTDIASGSALMQALIADPLSLFSARSPGARTDGALVQTKTAYAPAEAATADYRGTGPADDLPSPDEADDLPGVGPGQEALQTGDQKAFSIPGGLYGPSPPGFLFGGPGSEDMSDASFGGGGSGFGASGPPIEPFPTSGPVPEPGTWLMMIGGFFAVGSALRLRNARTTVNPTTGTGPAMPHQEQ